ncbi:MAG: hypothetical protein K6T92_01335 [Candidatus Rokubacteria bacterium]|nr:hypothetical protein [Candidatus Rokubacteria bacterium]
MHLGDGRIADVREIVAILDARRLARVGLPAVAARPAGTGRAGPAVRSLVVTIRGVVASPVSPSALAGRIRSPAHALAREAAKR